MMIQRWGVVAPGKSAAADKADRQTGASGGSHGFVRRVGEGGFAETLRCSAGKPAGACRRPEPAAGIGEQLAVKAGFRRGPAASPEPRVLLRATTARAVRVRLGAMNRRTRSLKLRNRQRAGTLGVVARPSPVTASAVGRQPRRGSLPGGGLKLRGPAGATEPASRAGSPTAAQARPGRAERRPALAAVPPGRRFPAPDGGLPTLRGGSWARSRGSAGAERPDPGAQSAPGAGRRPGNTPEAGAPHSFAPKGLEHAAAAARTLRNPGPRGPAAPADPVAQPLSRGGRPAMAAVGAGTTGTKNKMATIRVRASRLWRVKGASSPIVPRLAGNSGDVLPRSVVPQLEGVRPHTLGIAPIVGRGDFPASFEHTAPSSHVLPSVSQDSRSGSVGRIRASARWSLRARGESRSKPPASAVREPAKPAAGGEHRGGPIDAAPSTPRPKTEGVVMGNSGRIVSMPWGHRGDFLLPSVVRSVNPETAAQAAPPLAPGGFPPAPAPAAPPASWTPDATMWVRAALIDNARNLVTVTLSGTEQAVQVVLTGSQATIDQLAANGQQLAGVVRQSLLQPSQAIEEGEGKNRGQGRRFQRGRSPSTP